MELPAGPADEYGDNVCGGFPRNNIWVGYLRVDAVWMTRTELMAMRTAATGGGMTSGRPGSSSSNPAAAGIPRRLMLQAQRIQVIVVRRRAAESSKKQITPRRLQEKGRHMASDVHWSRGRSDTIAAPQTGRETETACDRLNREIFLTAVWGRHE